MLSVYTCLYIGWEIGWQLVYLAHAGLGFTPSRHFMGLHPNLVYYAPLGLKNIIIYSDAH